MPSEADSRGQAQLAKRADAPCITSLARAKVARFLWTVIGRNCWKQWDRMCMRAPRRFLCLAVRHLDALSPQVVRAVLSVVSGLAAGASSRGSTVEAAEFLCFDNYVTRAK